MGSPKVHAILTSVKMLSLLLPELLNAIAPLVLDSSRQEMRILAAGDAKNPESDMVIGPLVVEAVARALAMTVVPSHSLALNVAAPAVSLNVTVPDTNHVPTVP